MTVSLEFLSSAQFWIIVAALSEIIALSPLKSNSVVQLLLQALYAIKPGKRQSHRTAAGCCGSALDHRVKSCSG